MDLNLFELLRSLWKTPFKLLRSAFLGMSIEKSNLLNGSVRICASL